MASSQQGLGQEKRRDPKDGRWLSYQDTVKRYSSEQSRAQIKAYWDTTMRTKESSPLLPPSSTALPARTRGGIQFHAHSVAILVLVPWSVFLIVTTSTGLLLEKYAAVSYIIASLCVAMSFLFVVVNFRNAQGPIYLYLGVLCFVAVVCGACAGKMVNDEFMALYWSPTMKPTYSDVSPLSPAASVEDGGVLAFSEHARVDTLRGLGLWDEDDRSTYCVAPVLSAQETSEAEFWAIGIDCCAHRRSFACDQAAASGARSGVVVPQTGSRTDEKLATKLLRAVTQAVDVYGLHSPAKPVFLHWVQDVEEFRNSLRGRALVFILALCAVYLAVSLVLASLLHWSTGRFRAAGFKAPAAQRFRGTRLDYPV